MKSQKCKEQGRVAELVNRLGRAVHCIQFARGLNPAQWEALRYMSRANRYSRTPSALATFLGTTRGTASQTIKALEAKGLVRRRAEPADRRVCRLEITDAGSTVLDGDPIREIETVVAESGIDAAAALQKLDTLLQGLQTCCGMRSFGVCACCDHFGDNASKGEPDGPHRCGLTKEPLSTTDSTHICVNFQTAVS